MYLITQRIIENTEPQVPLEKARMWALGFHKGPKVILMPTQVQQALVSQETKHQLLPIPC